MRLRTDVALLPSFPISATLSIDARLLLIALLAFQVRDDGVLLVFFYRVLFFVFCLAVQVCRR